jgi:hypothetical protein
VINVAAAVDGKGRAGQGSVRSRATHCPWLTRAGLAIWPPFTAG